MLRRQQGGDRTLDPHSGHAVTAGEYRPPVESHRLACLTGLRKLTYGWLMGDLSPLLACASSDFTAGNKGLKDLPGGKGRSAPPSLHG
jgi:hypothetical protein